jgi:hypothetical protein
MESIRKKPHKYTAGLVRPDKRLYKARAMIRCQKLTGDRRCSKKTPYERKRPLASLPSHGNSGHRLAYFNSYEVGAAARGIQAKLPRDACPIVADLAGAALLYSLTNLAS